MGKITPAATEVEFNALSRFKLHNMEIVNIGEPIKSKNVGFFNIRKSTKTYLNDVVW